MPSIDIAPVSCPICGEGVATRRQTQRSVEHRERVSSVTLYHSVCDVCGAETVDDAESILNRRAINRFKKQVDGVPLGSQIRTMRKAAKLTQEQAGAVFGGGPVAFSKYENDDLMPDEAMANLLRLAIADLAIVERMRELKAGSTTTAIRLLPAPELASPSATWTYDDGVDDADTTDAHEVVASSSKPFSESNGNLWTH